MRFHSLKIIIISSLCLFLLIPSLSQAEEKQKAEKKPQGPPPMLIEATEITVGNAEPMVELIGTIRYGRVSRVASEVAGIVEKIDFREGEKVKKGQTLLQLRSDLLLTKIAGTNANYDQIQLKLDRARKELNRINPLYMEKSVSESLYDESHYQVLGLEKQLAEIQATLDRQNLELAKTSIKAPFSGLIQEKLSEQGEWVAIGGQIAAIADDRQLEAEIDVPQRLLGFLSNGQKINVQSGGTDYSARFIRFVPQGDVATRTFTVKLKLENARGLIEGMEATASLPNGPKVEGLLVPRDAIINKYGQQMIFTAQAGKAKMIPVQIKGYQGLQVAISGPGIEPGQQVVIKGNERIRDGQPIRFYALSFSQKEKAAEVRVRGHVLSIKPTRPLAYLSPLGE